jgi:type III secretion protein V
VFLVLTIIQFIVLAKGSERVAEVGARFVLDSMPASRWRSTRSSAAGASTATKPGDEGACSSARAMFYGAMDASMKFVKGDFCLCVVAKTTAGGVIYRDSNASGQLGNGSDAGWSSMPVPVGL